MFKGFGHDWQLNKAYEVNGVFSSLFLSVQKQSCQKSPKKNVIQNIYKNLDESLKKIAINKYEFNC